MIFHCTQVINYIYSVEARNKESEYKTEYQKSEQHFPHEDFLLIFFLFQRIFSFDLVELLISNFIYRNFPS